MLLTVYFLMVSLCLDCTMNILYFEIARWLMSLWLMQETVDAECKRHTVCLQLKMNQFLLLWGRSEIAMNIEIILVFVCHITWQTTFARRHHFHKENPCRVIRSSETTGNIHHPKLHLAKVLSSSSAVWWEMIFNYMSCHHLLPVCNHSPFI